MTIFWLGTISLACSLLFGSDSAPPDPPADCPCRKNKENEEKMSGAPDPGLCWEFQSTGDPDEAKHRASQKSKREIEALWQTLGGPPQDIEEISAHEVKRILDTAPHLVQVVDVRPLEEVRASNLGVVPFSLHIPIDELSMRVGELDPDKVIIVVCKKGIRSACGADMLRRAGFESVFSMRGGMEAW